MKREGNVTYSTENWFVSIVLILGFYKNCGIKKGRQEVCKKNNTIAKYRNQMKKS